MYCFRSHLYTETIHSLASLIQTVYFENIPSFVVKHKVKKKKNKIWNNWIYLHHTPKYNITEFTCSKWKNLYWKNWFLVKLNHWKKIIFVKSEVPRSVTVISFAMAERIVGIINRKVALNIPKLEKKISNS